MKLMDSLKRSRVLKIEADRVIGLLDLNELLACYHRVVPTGSYYLDVMIYPDIDYYVSKVTIEQLFITAVQLAKHDLVRAVVFEKSDTKRMKDGLYLKARVAYGDWGRLWKIDIWSLEDCVIKAKMTDMVRFKEKMTPKLREQIINYKASIITSQRRTPMYSGYFIYKAFVDEGITDPEEVSAYLLENGITI